MQLLLSSIHISITMVIQGLNAVLNAYITTHSNTHPAPRQVQNTRDSTNHPKRKIFALHPQHYCHLILNYVNNNTALTFLLAASWFRNFISLSMAAPSHGAGDARHGNLVGGKTERTQEAEHPNTFALQYTQACKSQSSHLVHAGMQITKLPSRCTTTLTDG